MDEKVVQRELEAVRRFAFCGVTLATIGAVVAIIAVPALYSHMQHIQSHMQNEVNFYFWGV